MDRRIPGLLIRIERNRTHALPARMNEDGKGEAKRRTVFKRLGEIRT